MPHKRDVGVALLVWFLLFASLLANAATAEPLCVPLTIGEACIDEFDSSPLGNRFPVILIHGWNHAAIPGEPLKDTWSNFADYVNSDVQLSSTIKLYVFTYYSNVTNVVDIGRALRDVVELKDGDGSQFGSRRLLLVSHSMGGLVARYFLQLSGQDRTMLLITLGTPHHGSMLANGPAMRDIAGPLWGNALQRLYDLFYPVQWYEVNRTDLFWDTFDKIFDYDRFRGEQNPLLNDLNADTTHDEKVVAYGGALGACSVLLDQYCLGSTVLGGIFDIANDGVVPVSSALFYTTPESTASRFRTHFFSDYDHSQMAMGKGEGKLFAQIKADLLAAIPHAPPPPPPPLTLPYDGRWTGRGTGTSSVSTPAKVDITLDVSNGVITQLNFPWRVDTRPGTRESSYCGGTGRVGNIRIDNNSFIITAGNGTHYSAKITGTFTSPNTITGTAEFIRQSGAAPWCASATLNWSGRKQ